MPLSQELLGSISSHEKAHWNGVKNKLIRYFFYCNRGLDLFNAFRYIAMLIFGLYVLLKLTNPIWLLVMFLTCIPVLIVAGWYQVNHMASVIDWLGVWYGSYWSKKSMDWQERQVKAVEEIRDCVVHPMRELKPEEINEKLK